MAALLASCTCDTHVQVGGARPPSLPRPAPAHFHTLPRTQRRHTHIHRLPLKGDSLAASRLQWRLADLKKRGWICASTSFRVLPGRACLSLRSNLIYLLRQLGDALFGLPDLCRGLEQDEEDVISGLSAVSEQDRRPYYADRF